MAGTGQEAVLADELRTILLSENVFDAVVPPGQADIAIVATIRSLDKNNDAQAVLNLEAHAMVDVFLVHSKTRALLSRFEISTDSGKAFGFAINGVPLHILDDKSKQAIQNAAYAATQYLKESRLAQGDRTKKAVPALVASAEQVTFVDAAPPPEPLAYDDLKGAVELGLRTGYALPVGPALGTPNASSSSAATTALNADLSDTVSGRVPIWLNAGYRLNKNIYFGLFGSLGFGVLPTNVCKNVDCSADDLHFGVDGQWHFRPQTQLDPWVGIGVGYEMLFLHQQSAGGSLDVKLRGFQFVNLQAGADYKVSRKLGIGPFAMGSLGQYSDIDSNLKLSGGSPQVTSSSAFTKTFHGWVSFGIRGEFDISLGNIGATADNRNAFGPTVVASGTGAASAGAARTDDSAAPAATSSNVAGAAPTGSPTQPPPALPTASLPATTPVPTPPSEMTAPVPPPVAPPSTQPSGPQSWPAAVGIADRTQCTYRCMNNGTAVDSADLERALNKQLGAIRQCSVQTSEYRTMSSDVSFGPDGRLNFSIDVGAARGAMKQCIARIPAPGYFKGPANQRWKCSDYCP